MMSAQDPRNKFKTSDYDQQEQELPGLQSKMTPQPDCGETSYKGHERLKGYKMLVTGGDSAMDAQLQSLMLKKVQMWLLTIYRVKKKTHKK